MTKEENLENVVYQLTELGFPRTALYEYLDSFSGVKSIPYDYRKRIGDDLVNYHVTIQKDAASGLHRPEGYQATLLQTHPIPHSHIAGIDTQELEGRLKAIDWNGYVPRNVEVSSAMYKAIIDLVNLGLWETKAAADISNRLQLRYWLNTPVEQDLKIRNHISDYQKSHYFPIKNDLTDIRITEAYNLLSGRAVLKFRQTENQPGNFYAQWKELSDGKLKTLPDFDLTDVLKVLPIQEAHQEKTGPKLIYDLNSGERVPVTLDEGGRKTPVYIEANPREQTLSIYDKDMARLYPDGLQVKERQRPTIYKQAPPIKKPSKNKGRSI